jgi:SAM-dependent methyltransferase
VTAEVSTTSTAIREQASETGGRTLEIFANTPRLNAWMFSKLEAGVRGDVLEGGSGIGNISRLLRAQATHLVVTDTEPHYLEDLQTAFAGDDGVDVAAFNLDEPPPPVVAARQYDTIVMVNVIEHIADDHGLVARLAGMLKPGGSLLVYVPACPFAFGSLDVALGHHRRYTPESLTALMRSAELEPTPPRYVNLLGLAGWWFSGRVLKRSVLSARAVALFEKLVPLVRLEDRFRLPIGLGLCTHATKVR